MQLSLQRLVVAVLAAVALALTACGPPQGRAGRVVDKDRTYWSATKQWTYELTVRTPDGSEHEFRVNRGDYNDCFRNSSYPRCTKR